MIFEMFWKKYNWYRVAAGEGEIRLNASGIGTVELGDKKICVVRFRDVWHAFALYCPHAGALLSEGRIDEGGNIVCPVHAYKYNIRNGLCRVADGYRLRTYRVEVRTDGFYIGVEEGRGL
jgi:3-phenylpropionate/trans-cinnamate dioxygenase ferredoxin subunit